MQKIVAIGIILALTIPVGTSMAIPQQETTYTRVLDEITGLFGYIPEMATMNGREVRTLDALTLLRENAAPIGSTEVAIPPSDAGFGIRAGASHCLIGAIISGSRLSAAQVLENESPAAGPGGVINCGPGYAYNTGVSSADVSAGVTAVACLNTAASGPGSWVVNPTACQAAPGGTAESQVGRSGFVNILISNRFFTIHIEQHFSGVAGWAPNPAGAQDIGVITLG